MNRRLRDWVREHLHPLTIYQTYLDLKPVGKNLVALCPFHSEKTPSFYYFTDTKRFYCFGCKKSGDEIDFLQLMESLDVPGVIEILQQRWSVPPPPWRTDSPEETARRLLREILLHAHQYYVACLDEPEGEDARQYLEKRGLPVETWKRYGLGYAPDSGQALYQSVTEKKKWPEWVIKQCGLWVERDGHWMDFFRNRIIFPIHDRTGQIMALAGRALDDRAPKYLNLRETLLFKKSQAFFGLGWALDAIREKRRVILVEGYFDALLLHHRGFNEAIAILGSHLSPENARWLARQVDTVYLAFDADEAGEKAVIESIRNLVVFDVELRVVVLPTGKDPADMMMDEDRHRSFSQRLEQALIWPAFLVHVLKKKFGKRPLENPGALSVLFDILEPVYRVSEVRAQNLAGTLAEHFQIMSGRQLFRDFLRSRRKKGARSSVSMVTLPKVPTYEYYLLAGLMDDPGRFEKFLEGVGKDIFEHSPLAPVYEYLLNIWYQDEEPSWEELFDKFTGSPIFDELVMAHQIVESPISDDQFEQARLFLLAAYYRRMAENPGRTTVNGEDPEEEASSRMRFDYLRRAVEIETRLGKHRLSKGSDKNTG